MGEYQNKSEELAICSVRDFLVGLLENKNWCEAERVGKVLRMLVGDRSIRSDKTEQRAKSYQELDELMKPR